MWPWSKNGFVGEGTSLGVGSEVPKAQTRPSLPSPPLSFPVSLLSAGQDKELLQHQACLCSIMLLAMTITDQPPKTVSQAPIKCFLS